MKKVFRDALKGLDDDIRNQALTHISHANESGKILSSNERLEFLGDAVISLAVALYLYEFSPTTLEGNLTRMRASLVSGASLTDVARKMGLGESLILGKGEEVTGGRDRPRILAGALEAVIGAYFVQHGWEQARELVIELLFSGKKASAAVDPKTLLQELVQSTPGTTYEYRVVSVKGPDHKPVYNVMCVINGEKVSSGEGGSKKEAEEEAAKNYLVKRGFSD